jgi:hypothetical protein
MKKLPILGFFCICCALNTTSQSRNSIEGKVIDLESGIPLTGVSIEILHLDIFTKSNTDGLFKIRTIPLGDQILHVSFIGYASQRIQISTAKNIQLNLGTIYLAKTQERLPDISIISLSESDLLDDDNLNSDNISGLFQSSKDAFLRAAAFNFGQVWFKVRGYDSSYGVISINGIKMNKLFDGRPQWSNWGGLNDVLRNQEFSKGLQPSEHTFGGLSGSTNFNIRASEYRAGKKLSISSTNGSYRGRLMGTYATGMTKNGWALAASASRRYAQEGYLEGTTYNAWSAFLAAEKKINDRHSVNLTAILASNRRGKSSPNTQEVFDLRGINYNAYWGVQEGKKRNSRIKEIFEPLFLISHFYNTEKTSIKSSLGYQIGHIGNSRLGYFNSPNPDPTYWKYLPSSFLRFQDDLDYGNAYLVEQEFINNGQINWEDLYATNSNNKNSLYYLYEDRVDDNQISFHSQLTSYLSDHSTINTGVSFKSLTSHNYAKMLDLLGGKSFVDLDQYALGTAQQNNLNQPDRSVGEAEAFQYNYNIHGSILMVFGQLQISKNNYDAFIGLSLQNTQYQRDGLYKNGTYPDNSFGKGPKQSFSTPSLKGGFTYKITGRHLLNANVASLSIAPTIRSSFSNSRVNNLISPNLSPEKILTVDFNYIFRSPKFQNRISAYYTKIKDATEISFFFAQGLLGDQADFVNEIITGVEKKHMGIELSSEYQLTPSLKIIGVGSFGQFTYDNNPQLFVQSESFTDENSDFGTAYLKNYHLSGTPQRAYSLGFEYRDPNYWWFQLNGNLLSHNYLDISPLLRTNNFYLDADGVPFVDEETGIEVNQEQVNSLLKQEIFDPLFLMNAVGGKSWLINEKYIGFFIGINNLLGAEFKTGGFEQSRKVNYKELKHDKNLETPVFGPKYWYGNTTSYYINLYVRF